MCVGGGLLSSNRPEFPLVADRLLRLSHPPPPRRLAVQLQRKNPRRARLQGSFIWKVGASLSLPGHLEPSVGSVRSFSISLLPEDALALRHPRPKSPS